MEVVAFDAKAEVEVWIDDDDGGGWYEATVVKRQRKRYKLLPVSSSSSSPQKLRTVPADSVRPRGSRLTPATSYTLGRLVEALHNGAWRPGVVSAAVQPERYKVSFPTSRVSVELKIEQMRPSAQWFPQGGQEGEGEGEGAMFGAGDQVEVYYVSAWFPGTIIEIISKTIFLVEYSKPKPDDRDSSLDLFREFLDARHIRPVPLRPPVAKPFKVHDKIEVCRCGGWTSGLVSNIIENGSKYVVKLKYGTHEEKEVELHHSEMWILRNWTKGRWITATKQRGQQSFAGKIPDQPFRVSTSTTSRDNDQFTRKIYKRKRRGGSGCEGRGESLHPWTDIKKGESLNQFCMQRGQQSFTGMIPDQLIQVSTSTTSSDNDQLNRKILKHKRGEGSGCEGQGKSLQPGNDLNKGESSNQLCMEVPKIPTDLSELHPAMQDFESPLVVGSSLVEPGLQPNFSFDEIHDEQGLSTFSSTTKFVDRDEGYSSSKGGGSEKLSEACNVNQSFINHETGATEHEHCKVFSDPSVNFPKGRKKRVVRRPGKRQEIPDVIDLTQHPEEEMKKKRGTELQERSRVVNQSIQIVPTDVSNVLQLTTHRDEVMLCEKATIDIEVMLCEKATENMLHRSEGNATIHTENTSNITSSKRLSVEEAATINPAPTHSSSMKTLPFVKDSSLWESIESMEAFRIMPQEPHFRPLEQYCRYFREGMAIGFMVIFVNLVAKVQKLDKFDSHATIEEILNSLVPLEDNGFDVQRMRSHVENLLEVRNKQKELENKKATLQQQIFEEENEKGRLDASQAELDKTIEDMKQELAILRESRNSYVMKLTNIESEIAKLQKHVEKIRDACLFYEQCYDRILASLW